VVVIKWSNTDASQTRDTTPGLVESYGTLTGDLGAVKHGGKRGLKESCGESTWHA
jgi:hypothetical protein